VQAQITASLLLPASGNIAQTTILTGYLELTDKTNAILASPANSGCLAALPFSPPDQPIPPTVAPTLLTPLATITIPPAYSTFIAPPSTAQSAPFGIPTMQGAIFNDSQAGLPSGVIGACGFHNGVLTGGGCTRYPFNQINSQGLAVDIVPELGELCFDSRLPSNLNQCDPNSTDAAPYQRVPIFAPVGGCASYDMNKGSPEITIDVNQPCNARTVPRLQVVLTHLIPVNRSSVNISAGDKIGDFCTRNDWINFMCGTSSAIAFDSPVHVAFQLRILEENSIDHYWPLPAEYLKYLSSPSCLYDRWSYTFNSTPVVQPSSSAIQSCP